MPRKYLVFPIVAVVAILFDQVTKYWARTAEALQPPSELTIIPHFLSFSHAENPGAAFGMLSGLSDTWRLVLFVSFTVVAIVVVLDLWRRLPKSDWFLSTVLGLIISGAIGNGIDRVLKAEHTVTDFIRVYTDYAPLKTWLEESPLGMSEWPAFNVADSTLVVGVALFLVHYLFIEDRSGSDEEAEAEADADAETGDAEADAPTASAQQPEEEEYEDDPTLLASPEEIAALRMHRDEAFHEADTIRLVSGEDPTVRFEAKDEHTVELTDEPGDEHTTKLPSGGDEPTSRMLIHPDPSPVDEPTEPAPLSTAEELDTMPKPAVADEETMVGPSAVLQFLVAEIAEGTGSKPGDIALEAAWTTMGLTDEVQGAVDRFVHAHELTMTFDPTPYPTLVELSDALYRAMIRDANH